MENQEKSASLPKSSTSDFSKCSTITAQNSGIAVVPQVSDCQIGSLNITFEQHIPSAANAQQTKNGASNIACNISHRVTEKLKYNLKRKFEIIFEGMAKRGNPTLLKEIYTELYITEGEREGLNKEHEVWQIDTMFKVPHEQEITISCNDIFKPLRCRGLENRAKEKGKTKDLNHEQSEKAAEVQPRTVLTKGIAGIGKTVSVQKFILDWAEGKANQDIDFLFVLPFRELNSFKDEKQSLHELLLNFYSDLEEFENTKYYQACKIMFIFDGLDESQLSLHFGMRSVSVVSKQASLDELMANLIDGTLLPSALVWITSRPAAIDKIPPNLIHRMTEVQGFTNLQKEEYFRKRIRDQNLANKIMSHVKKTRSLEIMCHIPVFCWITATVLEQMLRRSQENFPSSLTELYTRFLLTQTNEKKKKYHKMNSSDPLKLSDEDVQLILKLGKLAFDNLQKSNIVFSEEDLIKYGIDVTEASVRSGVFTEILKEEDPMFSVKKYSFVHLSFQEYLAAFFVFHTYADKSVNAMQSSQNKHAKKFSADSYYYDDDNDDDFYYNFSDSDDGHFGVPQTDPQQQVTLYDLQKCAVDKALKSNSGHLDLFLRFLLGLSVESSQKLLISIPMHVVRSQENIQQTLQYLKSKLREEDERKTPCSERCINLFLCLLELGDHSMVEEIRKFLTSDRHGNHKLTAAQCSALAYIVLMSGDILEDLDVRNYNISEEAFRRLIPAVRNCKRAILVDCGLTKTCVGNIASALQNPEAYLTELDLSKNVLREDALTYLQTGLKSPYCRLETLNLSQNNLEKTGASLLEAILMGPHIQPHTLKVFSCGLKDDCAEIFRSALWSSDCRLRELDLGYNNLSSNGVKTVLQGLLTPNCDLEILRLSGNLLNADCCSYLASIIKHSFLRELNLDSSNIGDLGAKRLFSGLMSPHCQLQKLGLRDCKLSKTTCFYLTVALSSYSVIRVLNLGDNDLQDLGVKRLSAGLKNPNCVLQKLGLSGCMLTEEGCSSLASALKSNPSQLRELDLSYNHPGESGERMLSARLKDPNCKLLRLKLDHGGPSQLTAGLWKYHQELHIGHTHGSLECSKDRKGVIRLPVHDVHGYNSDEEKKEPDKWANARSREQLNGGRFYWEVEWTGTVSVGVSDLGPFKGHSLTIFLHQYHQQYQQPYYVLHNEKYHTKSMLAVKVGPVPPQRIGMLLDWLAGTLSFYSISPQEVCRLYTFHTTFTKPMYAIFELTLPSMWDTVPCIVIANKKSCDSTLHTKEELLEHVREYIHYSQRLRCGMNFFFFETSILKTMLQKFSYALGLS
ncbi:NACHT, LRR and PYD domains-containing protein 12-like isoform X2 [Hoplias malabaricus]|uniref:NACHT, LRR and PYD domains-containing protein 12-like isoform X2 n=1 Tax=Hoplias malabaricus TaxID=27720 RepID=UPI0034627A07